MEITFLGVRGSCPVSGSREFGGNTSCLQVRSSGGGLIFLDAGTGLRESDVHLPETGRCSVLLSHVHWDHVQGLPFFKPLYLAGWQVDVYVPPQGRDILDVLFDGVRFPVTTDELRAEIRIIPYETGASLSVAGLKVRARALPHPGGNMGFRLEDADAVVAVTGDCEILGDEPAAADLLHKADLAVVDGHYDVHLYEQFRGWGHSPRDVWFPIAQQAGVGALVFTHHDPDSTDEQLLADEARLAAQGAAMGLHTAIARQYVVWRKKSGFSTM